VIGNWDEQRLEAFVRQRLNLPENLRKKLAGSLLKTVDPSDVGVAFGAGTVTFTAAATSAQVTIAHGLGKVPVFVDCFVKDPSNGLFILIESAAADATNIYISARQTQNTAVTTTQNFYWLAIG
jgi:hypothetical protein